MQLHRRPALGIMLIALCLSLFSGYVYSLGSQEALQEEAAGSDVSLTPPPGSPQRKAILDAMRTWVERGDYKDTVFVVVHLKSKDGWAWLHTRPRTKDGSTQYEDLSALLQLKDGAWSVAEVACGEVDNPECLDGPEYFVRLQERFPDVSSEIFPD